VCVLVFCFSSRRRHTRSLRDWSSDVCSSDLIVRTFQLKLRHFKEIMDPEPLAEKWRSFNWNVRTIADGNDLGQVIEALDEAGRGGGPWLLLAHTVKGKGVSFMEGKWAWHGKAPTAEEAARALEEIARHG